MNLTHEIGLNDYNCCKIIISTYQLWDLVFRPALTDLIKKINENISELDKVPSHLDFVYVNEDLINACSNVNSTMLNFIILNLSQRLGLDAKSSFKTIESTSINGAALYGRLMGQMKTRKVTYFVSVEAFNIIPFDAQILNQLHSLQNTKDAGYLHKVKAENAYRGDKSVNLFHATDRSTALRQVSSYDLIPLTFSANLSERYNCFISRKFLANEECLVYACIT